MMPQSHQGYPLKNTRWELFAHGICEGKTGKQSAVDAGYKWKYARQQASKLLQNTTVRRRVEELKSAAAHESILTRREALKILTQHARAKLADYIHLENRDVAFQEIDETTPNPHAIKRIKRRTVKKVNASKSESCRIVGIELHDPIRAIHALNAVDGFYDAESTRSHSL